MHMSNFHTLDIDFNNYHLVFPYAIGAILAILLVAMGAKKAIAGVASRSGGASAPRPGFSFFDIGFDRKKLFGALGCTVAYALLLTPLGFLLSSILFMLGISLIFKPDFRPRALIGLVANSVITPLVIWVVFGQMFDITLP